MRTTRTIVLALALATIVGAGALAQELTLPNRADSLKFALIGDSGTGNSDQYRVAKVLTGMLQKFKYEFVVMMGDNMYGGESSRDFQRKFEEPYKDIMKAGIKFYAALGNHDSPNQAMYKNFNMGGERYYTFKPKGGIRFFALDSNYMDKVQLAWLEKELKASGSDWKIAFFHHPIYSSEAGRHGSDTALRDQLEPLFLKYSVDVVLSGHEHFYVRLKPQKGIQYFVSGNSGKVRRGDIGNDPNVGKGFDQGYAFMLMEIAGDQLHFQAISDQGKTIDSGIVLRNAQSKAPANAPPATVTIPKAPDKNIPPPAKPPAPPNKPAAPAKP
jgi:predicted phosphodiesterase